MADIAVTIHSGGVVINATTYGADTAATVHTVSPVAFYGDGGGATYGGSVSPIPTVITGAVRTGGQWPGGLIPPVRNVVNLVWDSQYGGAGGFVSWTSPAADPQGFYYPRGGTYGTYGVHTSQYACLGPDRRTAW